MKLVEQMNERQLKAAWKPLNRVGLTEQELELRTKIEARQWELYVAKHPPIKTPPNFIEKDGEWGYCFVERKASENIWYWQTRWKALSAFYYHAK